MKIGELLRYTNYYQWVWYEGISFVVCLAAMSISKFEIYKFDLPCHLTAVQIVWTVLVHFMLSVLSLGFIFIEEIEPCQVDR